MGTPSGAFLESEFLEGCREVTLVCTRFFGGVYWYLAFEARITYLVQYAE